MSAPTPREHFRLRFKSFKDILRGMLNDDGTVDVGLGGGSEGSTPDNFRIPVPRNIASLDGGDVYDITRAAHWAYTQMFSRSGGDMLLSAGAAMAWVYGCVVVKGPKPANDQLPTTVAELQKLPWDSEVVVLDSEAGELDFYNTAESVRESCGWLSTNYQSILTCVVAAKMTWWSTQSHIGVQLAHGTQTRQYAGFAEKVVKSLKIFDFTVDTDRTKFLNMVKPWSTIEILCQLAADSHKSLFRERYSLPLVKTGKAEFGDFEVKPDVRLRIGSFGAGWAPLSDMIAALKHMATQPILGAMPGCEHSEALAKEYVKVKSAPYSYGINAHYLTGQHKPENMQFNLTPYTELRAGLATWLAVNLPNSTLRNAAVFSGNLIEMEGYNDAWHSLCIAYLRIKRSAQGTDEAKMLQLSKVAGVLIGHEFSATFESSMHEAGVIVQMPVLKGGLALFQPSAAPEGNSDDNEESESREPTPGPSTARGRKRGPPITRSQSHKVAKK